MILLTGATGTVGSETPVTLVALDGRIYVTGDAEFMATRVGADAAKRIAGKWLLLPPAKRLPLRRKVACPR